MDNVLEDLRSLLRESPYHDYVYSYPHKTAYRRLDPPRTLEDAWATEDRSALFLYIHVPFCEMRCGFCNLFTEVGGADDRITAYLKALTAQAHRTRRALPDARFVQMAIGGGTPTVLSVAQLESLLRLATDVMGTPAAVPTSVEVSPATTAPEKLDLLKSWGVSRISIGVQSFDTRETSAALRPQHPAEVDRALCAIRDRRFPSFNIDLIYGLPGQTPSSFAQSIERALAYEPTELYLYPLYIRPATPLGRKKDEWRDLRAAIYEMAQATLRARGFKRHSMRRFSASGAPESGAASYRCQEDGMVGLGPGARSYTRRLHYSTRYAVSQTAIRGIIDDFIQQDHGRIEHGLSLDPEEERRRFLILSLLDCGVDSIRYQARFNSELGDDFPELTQLVEAELARSDSGTLRLTDLGTDYSDTIGHWLFSPRVRGLMGSYLP